MRRLVCLSTLLTAAAIPRLAVAQTSSFELELMNLARQSELYGRFPEAERLYGQVIAVNPGNQTAHHRLGVLAARNNDLDRAIAYFTSAERAGPPAAQLLNDFGGVLYLKGNLTRAEQKLRAALTIDPGNVDAANNLELVRAQQAVRAEARARAIAEAQQTARARLEEDAQATAQTMAAVRMASRARAIAEARAAAESQATARAVASSRAARRLRTIAEARAQFDTQVASVAYNQPATQQQIDRWPSATPQQAAVAEQVPAGGPLEHYRRAATPIGAFWSWCTSFSLPWRNRATETQPLPDVVEHRLPATAPEWEPSNNLAPPVYW